MPWIEPDNVNYCLPCSLQMILRYFNYFRTNQAAIDREVQQDPLLGELLLNRLLNGRLPNNITYNLIPLPEGFARTNRDLVLLEEYITANMNLDIPILLGYDQLPNEGHAIVITGINIDLDNPENTVYYINDPNDRTDRFIYGRDLATYFPYGGEVVGALTNFDFINKKIEIHNFAFDKSKWFKKIYGSYPDSITQIVDLQEQAGIVNFNQIKNMKYLILNQMGSTFFYDGMNIKQKEDIFWNTDNFINGWSGWKWLNNFSGELDYGLNHSFLNVWHATNFYSLNNNHFGGRISYRVDSSCSGFANYPVLKFDMGSEWDIVY